MLWADGIESGPVAAGGAVAAVIGLVVWLVTKGVPSMIDKHDAQLEKARADYMAESQRRTEASERQSQLSRDQHLELAKRYEVVVADNSAAIRSFQASLNSHRPP